MRRDGESGSSDFVALREALAGRAPRDTARTAVYRLLTAADRQPASHRALREAAATPPVEAYENCFEGALAALPTRLDAAAAERDAAAALASHLAEIARVSPAEARQRAAATDPQRLGAVVRALVAMADALAVGDPSAGIALAGVAVAAVEAGRPAETDVARCDLRAVARRCLAEAAFRGGDLVAAEGSLAEATRLSRLGSRDAVLRAELSRVAAEIRSDQSRFDEARRLAAHSVTLLAKTGETRLEGRSRVTLAMKLFLDGRHDAALAENARAMARLDPGSDPRWRLAAEFNHAFWSCELGDLAAAQDALPRLADLADRSGSEHDRICLTWLRARIAVREGELESAIRIYRAVLARCLELDTVYDSAMVALELAVVLLELDRADEVLPLADTVAPIFKAQGVEPEAAAAVLLAAESLRRGVAAREVLLNLLAARAGARRGR